MDGAHLLAEARLAAGLSQQELADRSGTSRPTLSAYENGRKSPALATTVRVLARAGFELRLAPVISFTERPLSGGRIALVPDRLPRLDLERALATVQLPLHLNWSDRGRLFNLGLRSDRSHAYEIVLREGGPSDVTAYIDGALLVDLWDELVLPQDVRAAWSPVVGAARAIAA